MTRRIISAVKFESSAQPERPAAASEADTRTNEHQGAYIDPSFVVEIDRMGQPVREFNDYIVVI